MKKLFFILMTAMLLVMCKSAKTTAPAAPAKAEVLYKDDFKAAPEAERTALLKALNAGAPNYSVLILTENYKGEQIIASNVKKKLYSGYAISNLKTGIADSARIDNTLDTRVYDTYTKKEVVITAKEAQKHKFIYLMKKPGTGNPFVVTYSNTLKTLQ